jgi:hypothetical protein
MTKFLRADCVRIFGCSRFAVPPGDPVPKASSLAGDASIPDWYVSSRPRRRARSTNHGMTSRRIRCLTRRNAARGVEYILIAVVDGLKGFPEAIEAVFPQTMTQTCIVHLIRHALETVSWKDRKALMPSLKATYQAATAEAAEAALDAFEASAWAKRYPMIAPSVAPGLRLCGAVLRLPAGDQEDDLRHERGGDFEPQLAQGDHDTRQLPL